jgi:hypothetical protein
MRNKGKGRNRGNDHRERTNNSPRRRRSNSSQAAQADALDQLGLAIMTCSESVHANTQEMEQIRHSHAQELEQLQLKTTRTSEDMQNIWHLYESICTRNRGQDDRSDFIHAMASRVLYAERRSSEGTVSYERQQSARAQFEATQNLGGPRIIEEDRRASPDSRTENWSERTWQYAVRMAEARVRATRPQGRTSGPPNTVIRRGDRDTDSDGSRKAPTPTKTSADMPRSEALHRSRTPALA